MLDNVFNRWNVPQSKVSEVEYLIHNSTTSTFDCMNHNMHQDTNNRERWKWNVMN